MTKEQKKINISLISLGCPKNLVDSECMISLLQGRGFSLVEDINCAQVAVINTCGFIESAKKEAIDTILSVADLKKPNGNLEYIVVTGCLPQRYDKDILESMPEVDAVLGTSHYKDVAEVIISLYESNNKDIDLVDDAGGIDHLLEERYVSTGSYAYLKIGEGCRNRCSFCAIPLIRGNYISRPMDEVLKEAQNLVSRGFKEIILAAQDTTNYGIDFDGKRHLVELLKSITTLDGDFVVRIMYGYMDGIDDDLINEIKTNPKIAHYMDIPIQHGDDHILKAMRRRDDVEKITSILANLRKEIPDIIIRTTVLVGFPGETEEMFNNLITNLQKWRFDRLGCFAYSPEEGTDAYDMPDQIDQKTKELRVSKVYEVQKTISEELNKSRLDSVVKVTIDCISDDGIFYKGRSYGEAPEVDPEIFVAATDDELEIGKSYMVRIVDSSDYELTGVTI